MLVFNSQSRQIILLWLSVCMIWGYFLHRKEGFTSFFIICIHCHIWSWNGLGSYGCLKNLCSFIHRYFHSYYCCCCNLQAKLHGSASTKVLSVSEKQPPPEEVWTQKVQISLGWFFFYYMACCMKHSICLCCCYNDFAVFGRGFVIMPPLYGGILE